MPLDELVHRVGKGQTRRKFIRRAGTALLGATYVTLGLPQPAEAGHLCYYKCCVLCRCPSASCCGGVVPYCVWSWTCCYAPTFKRYRCLEYYCSSGEIGRAHV